MVLFAVDFFASLSTCLNFLYETGDKLIRNQSTAKNLYFIFPHHLI
jgi:hypothetical protein